MEKRNQNITGSGGKSRTKIFGGNKVEVGEDDTFRLIGSVIEKGISDNAQSSSFSPTPPPKVTVLPFPVARHRSHGPHWGSEGRKKGKDDDNDDNVGDEDDDIDGVYAIAAFANQVERKQKKGLDFSKWKELATDDSSVSEKVEKHLRLGKTEKRWKDGEKNRAEDNVNVSSGAAVVDVDASVPLEMDVRPNENTCVSLGETRKAVTSGSCVKFVDSVADMELDNNNFNLLLYPGNEKGRGTGTIPVNNSDNGVGRLSCDDFADLESSRPATVSSSRTNDFGNEQGSPSLESEIDAENHARLQTMTPDEIAQAQAEIMEKMNPALLNLLKKRGQDKLKKRKYSSSVLATDVDMCNGQNESQSIQDAKGSSQIEKDVSHSLSGRDDRDLQRLGQAGGFLWNAWSDRVEAVRQLRFSLDGSVISHDFVPKLDSGDNSALNSLNADNVAERDYLRTEGDPGAAGYTIREAVALTRSMVPGQRTLALHLLASVLDKALNSIYKNQFLCASGHDNKVDRSVDWEAVWAYALGPEPELILSLRLVCEDITGGQEKFPIPATNLVDDPPVAPTGFTYRKTLQVGPNIKLPTNAVGCNCKALCVDPRTCACAKLNGSDFPYVHRDGGRLIEPKDVVFECGPKCGCGPDCFNRTSQKGLMYRLEVFRTPKKGWAVRSWDFIPSGAPVCEYIGVLMRTEDVDNVSENDNNYIFDIDCLQTIKGLGGRERRLRDVSIPTIDCLDRHEDQRSESLPEFCIDAGSTGNIARFINHSCEPNLFVQCILSSHHDLKLARVVLFAADNIPPLQELTYDYGYALDSVCGPDGKVKRMLCFCGAADCRTRLF